MKKRTHSDHWLMALLPELLLRCSRSFVLQKLDNRQIRNITTPDIKHHLVFPHLVNGLQSRFQSRSGLLHTDRRVMKEVFNEAFRSWNIILDVVLQVNQMLHRIHTIKLIEIEFPPGRSGIRGNLIWGWKSACVMFVSGQLPGNSFAI